MKISYISRSKILLSRKRKNQFCFCFCFAWKWQLVGQNKAYIFCLSSVHTCVWQILFVCLRPCYVRTRKFVCVFEQLLELTRFADIKIGWIQFNQMFGFSQTSRDVTDVTDVTWRTWRTWRDVTDVTLRMLKAYEDGKKYARDPAIAFG